MAHNFGHHAASLAHILGTMTKSMDKSLKYDDIVSQRIAERKHIIKEGGQKKYRGKKKAPQVNKDNSYEPGCEPI